MPNHAQQPQNTTKMNQLLPSDRIKAEARRLGFAACGLAPAAPVAASVAGHFRRWLHNGKQGGMGYLANHVEMRLDPRLLLEGAQTVICVALNYYPPVKLPPDSYQIACYAYGKDYHEVMKNKLRALLAYAQKAAVKTNLLYDATTTLNLGVEVGIAHRWTIDLSGNLNPWTFSDNTKWKHWLIQPEARYWLCERFNGHFLGAHVLGNPASEIITLAAMAIDLGLTAEEWKRVVFPHPTVGEIFREVL